MSTINNQLHELLVNELTDNINESRDIIALYLTGSYARHMTHNTSDLDLALIVKPTKYDLLTNNRFDKQVIFDQTKQIAQLLTDLNLVNTKHLSKIDIRIISVQSFYKQLLQMSPDIFDMVYQKSIWLNQDLDYNVVKELEQVPDNIKSKINLSHYLDALLGIFNNISHHLDKNTKMLDTIKYFTVQASKLILPNKKQSTTAWYQDLYMHTEPNYYHTHQIAQASTELLTTADLLKTRNQLEYLRDKINQDSNLKEKQQIAQALITNIFVNAF